MHTCSSGLSLLLEELRVKPPWLLCGREADHSGNVLDPAPQPQGSSDLEELSLL